MARHTRRLTQTEVAARAGTTRQLIRALEVGADVDPRFSTVERVANALGFTLRLDTASAV